MPAADTYADVTVAAATQRLAGRSASRIDLDKRGRSLKFLTTDPGPSGEDDDCDVVQPRDVGSPCSPLRAGWSWLICARWLFRSSAKPSQCACTANEKEL